MDIIERLVYAMSEEGLYYCFDGYSNWEDVEDETFHEKRKAFLKSANELINCVKHLAVDADIDIVDFCP